MDIHVYIRAPAAPLKKYYQEPNLAESTFHSCRTDMILFAAEPVAASEGCYNCEEEPSASPDRWNNARCVYPASGDWGRGPRCEVKCRSFGGNACYEYCDIQGGACLYYVVTPSTAPQSESAVSARLSSTKQKIAYYF